MFENFRKWMKYNPPHAETMDGWDKFDKDFKENAPIRYFFMRGVFHTISTRIKWRVKNTLYAIKYVITKPDIVRTDLPRTYHDKPELIFHACFSLLVDYVEKECAHMNCAFGKKEKLKKLMGWKRFLPYFLRFRQHRHKEFGVDYLKWEIGLENESPYQAENAAKILDLYLWYTEKRPNRVKPECPELPKRIRAFFSTEWKENNPEEYAKFKEWCDETSRLEVSWQEEDDKMLLELVKIRNSLWT